MSGHYVFNASAIGLGGVLTSPKRKVIPSLASVALAPTGGEGVGIVTNYDDGENYKVNLSSPKSIGLDVGNESFPSYAAIDTGSKTTTIKDDDSTVRINDVSQDEGDSGTNPMVFTVSLDNASAVPVSIKAGTQNGSATQPSDYTATTQVLTFAPGETSKSFSVPIKGDTTHEANENFLVLLTQPSNTAVGDGTGAGVIKNDD